MIVSRSIIGDRSSSDACGRSGGRKKVDRLTAYSPMYEEVVNTAAATNVNANAAIKVILPDHIKDG